MEGVAQQGSPMKGGQQGVDGNYEKEKNAFAAFPGALSQRTPEGGGGAFWRPQFASTHKKKKKKGRQ